MEPGMKAQELCNNSRGTSMSPSSSSSSSERKRETRRKQGPLLLSCACCPHLRAIRPEARSRNGRLPLDITLGRAREVPGAIGADGDEKREDRKESDGGHRNSRQRLLLADQSETVALPEAWLELVGGRSMQ
jgi:hypothetical protein